MRRKRIFGMVALTCLSAIIATTGCTQQKATESKPVVQQPGRPVKPTTGAPKVTPKALPGWPTQTTTDTMLWTALTYPTGDVQTSSIGLEKGFPQEVRVNQPFEYKIVVTNLTNHELGNVVVKDEVEDLIVASATPPSDEEAPGLHAWYMGTFGPRESKTITIRCQAQSEGMVGSCATVEHDFLLCNMVPVVQPKLRLTKTGPAEVLKCDEILYKFVVSNPGSGAVSGVRISDQLPAGLVTADGKKTIAFDVGTLAAGASKPFSAKVQAERAGRFENKATATGAGGLSVASGTVTTVVRQPVLTIAKTCPGRQFIGRQLDYSITVTNTGDGVARDAMIEDTIPADAAFVSASDGGRFVGGKVVWTLGDLAPRASKKVTMRLNPAGAGTYRNTASAKAYCAKTVTDSCESLVTGIPAILLEVIDLEDPDEVGTNEIYVITVTNQGSLADTNIRIVCTLEPNQQYVSTSGATRGTGRGNQIIFEPLASLAPKAMAEFRVVVRNVAPGDVRFSVSMTSDQLTRPVEENEATNVYE